MGADAQELAYYYPNPVWYHGDWVKNLVLFFDGIALLVPEYMREAPFAADPSITEGLVQHGLLTILEPEKFIDKEATERLATAMTDIIASGALDHLATESVEFHTLSSSRLGYYADPGLAKMIYQELENRGLARQTQDGVSIPMHPTVRSLVLVLLSQILRVTARQQGFELHPATDHPEIHAALQHLLSQPVLPSAGHVVTLDMQTVGIDLSAVPIGDVLAFRRDNGPLFSDYRRDLRRFVREVASLPTAEQSEALKEREAELKERAEKLHSLSRRMLKGTLPFALSLAGAVWTVKSGDLLGGLLTLGGIMLEAASNSPEAGAFSYLFRARQNLV